MYTLGRTPLLDLKYTVGIAYVAIPADVDRETYIRDCYRNYTISVWGDDGSFMNRLPVSPEVMNHLEFPAAIDQLGSPVVYVTEESQSLPIIIARFPVADQMGDAHEWAIKWSRSFEDAHVVIEGSPKNKNLSMSVDGGTVGGAMLWQVTGQQPGQLAMAVNGDISCNASEGVSFKQQGMFRSTTVDRTAEEGDDSKTVVFEQYPGQNSFKGEKFIINNGEEPLVLGNKLKSFLSDLIDEISKTTVTTAIGQQPLLNATQIAAFKNKTDEFLSNVGYINK
ncbi:hypothetical protein SAMN05444266_102215 [Chitinophaga jiangningensis]|uniref:Uncharacterized protein n=1 Tax=Chitinophaga jiangningensis TaxID=1419482 RepID=A0A1M6Y9C6_9BACT|nr:hypothetical protein [Chitinophaga jiangningensis]SHL14906.1 hypothetical protein SAMN05444266_102215 [Chitinophaga jiangningensis]